ncbi:MAG: DUF2336 domain-containing protein [Kiloniellales bacterium]
MGSEARDLRGLLDLALDSSVQARHALTLSVSDLFDDETRVLSERERALMSDILGKLIRDCEHEVRQQLSARLAKRGDAPHDVVLALANDTIEVARPILLQSEVLRDEELIEIVRHRTTEHQLAIAMRRTVSEPVSEALVETNSIDVIKTLLHNSNAKISEATLAYLTEESQRVDSYQEPLLNRAELPPALAERMYAWVSAALRQHIIKNFDVHPTALDDDLEAIVKSAAPAGTSGTKEPEAAAVLARHLGAQGSITPQLLIQVLRQGEIHLFEALFQEISGLKPPRLQRVIYESGGNGLAIACRALEIPKPTFATIFLLSRRGRPGNQTVDPRELSRALAAFDRINPKNAMHVVRNWRRDPKYQEAIEKIASTSKAS